VPIRVFGAGYRIADSGMLEEGSRSAAKKITSEILDTLTPMVTVAADKSFEARFTKIVERWYANALSQVDRAYLFSTNVAVDEFVELTEQINFKHGIELLNHRVKLTECATRVHECLSRKFDSWVRNAYGEQNIHFVGSKSKYRPIL